MYISNAEPSSLVTATDSTPYNKYLHAVPLLLLYLYITTYM